MAGDTLHNFDLQLCEYVRGNIVPHFSPVISRLKPNSTKRTRNLLSEPPDFSEFVRASLAPSLADFIFAEHNDNERPIFLLNDSELSDLSDAVFLDAFPVLDRFWIPYLSLHERRVLCVKEIRDGLTRQDG